MTRNISIGQILFVNPKTRSAVVFDETNNRRIIVPLEPIDRDDDYGLNTVEFIPKEGARVKLGTYNNDVVILGPAPTQSFHRDVDTLAVRRTLTAVNRGDDLQDDLFTDDLAVEEGYQPLNAQGFGSYDPIYRKEEGTSPNFTSSSADDLMPGDKIISNSEGSAIAVLEGGVSIFKASELCQIVGLKYNDLMRVVSRNFEQFTDFGNIIIKNDDGATSYVIEGAASQSEVSAGRYTLRIQMGAAGDLYKISIHDGNAAVVSVFHMKGDGSIALEATRKTVRVRGAVKEFIHTTKDMTVQGNVTNEYKQDYETTIRGSEQRTIVSNQVIKVQQDQIVDVTRNYTSKVGGTKTEDVFGTLDYDADSQTIFVGQKSEVITTQGNFRRLTTLGDFLRTTLTGNLADWTFNGDLTRTTFVGNIEDFTVKGNLYRTSWLGNIEDLTLGGNITRQTKVGNIDDSTLSGNIDIYTSAGHLIIEAGVPGLYSTITLSPTGTVSIEDGYGNSIETSAGKIIAKEAAGATLNLQTGQVALGSNVAELLDLVDQVLDELDKNQDTLLGHIHFSPLGPTTPPQQTAELTAVKTKLLIIKGLLNTIKGSV